MKPAGRRRGTLAVAGAMLAACGSSSSSSAGGSLADQSAKQIARAAQDAAIKARSVHMAGSVTSSGSNLSFNVNIAQPKGLSGTMAIEGKGKFGITTVDGSAFYVTPDDQFWTNYGKNNPAFLLLVTGKCISASAGDSGFGDLASGLSAFTNFDQLFGTITGDSSVTKGSIVTVNGQQAIQLKVADGSVLDVATSGAPYPLEVSKSGTSGGKIDLDQWNSARVVAPPTGCVALSALGGGLASPTP